MVVVSSAIKRDNPGTEGGARAPAAGGAPRRDAGRADAPQAGDRHRRHPRQDHHHLDGRGAARCRRASTRPSSTAASSTPTAPMRAWARATGWWSRPTSCDGTFVKLPADVALVTNIDPGASRPLRHVRPGARGLPPVRRERAVLRLRRDVHRPPGGAGADRPHRGPAHRHLRRQPAGGRALHRSPRRGRPLASSPPSSATAQSGDDAASSRTCRSADARRAQRPERHRRARRRPSSRRRRRGDRPPGWPASAASSAASPAPAHGTASRSSTTTPIIRSRSPRC